MHINTKKNCTLVCSLLIFWLTPHQAWAILKAQKVNSANELYKTGNYEASIEKYKQVLKNDPESDIINFNVGTAYFKQGLYDKAAEHLQKSVLTDDDGLRQQAHYNLGDAFFRAGENLIKNDLNKTIELFTMALGEYEMALQLNKDDKDAQFNYEYVKKRLDQLKQQQQQQQNQKKDKDKKQDKNRDQSKQSSSDQQKNNQQNDQQQDQQNQQKNNNQQNKQDQQNNQNEQKDQNNPSAGQNQNQPNGQQNQDQQDSQNSSGQGQNEQQDKDQPNQEDPDKRDDQQNQPQQQNQQNQPDESKGQDRENKTNNSGQPQMTDQQINAGELTEKEAQMLLQDYQQSIEPKGLLNFNVKSRSSPVLKDW